MRPKLNCPTPLKIDHHSCHHHCKALERNSQSRSCSWIQRWGLRRVCRGGGVGRRQCARWLFCRRRCTSGAGIVEVDRGRRHRRRSGAMNVEVPRLTLPSVVARYQIPFPTVNIVEVSIIGVQANEGVCILMLLLHARILRKPVDTPFDIFAENLGSLAFGTYLLWRFANM